MASFRLKAAAAVLAIAATLLPASFASAQVTRPQGIGPAPPAPTSIIVNLPARTLYWYKNGQLLRTFPVGVGTSATQTPPGTRKVLEKAVHPWWQPPWGGAIVPPGPQNPLGTRWMGLGDGYGIHGTNAPDSIGYFVSHGCIRMYVPDVEWLYEQVPVGTPVLLAYDPVGIQFGPGGRRYLALYPDAYGRGAPSIASVLTAAGLEADAVSTKEAGLYALDAGAVVNGQEVPAIRHQGRVFLAARAMGAQLSTPVMWDPATATVLLDGQPVATVLRGATGYVDAEAAAAILGVEYQWDDQAGVAVFTGRPLFLNGHLLSREGDPLEG
jgi:L,D-transpeptidase ErfK/SrfK